MKQHSVLTNLGRTHSQRNSRATAPGHFRHCLVVKTSLRTVFRLLFWTCTVAQGHTVVVCENSVVLLSVTVPSKTASLREFCNSRLKVNLSLDCCCIILITYTILCIKGITRCMSYYNILQDIGPFWMYCNILVISIYLLRQDFQRIAVIQQS